MVFFLIDFNIRMELFISSSHCFCDKTISKENKSQHKLITIFTTVFDNSLSINNVYIKDVDVYSVSLRPMNIRPK